jgi:hypothetical protein
MANSLTMLYLTNCTDKGFLTHDNKLYASRRDEHGYPGQKLGAVFIPKLQKAKPARDKIPDRWGASMNNLIFITFFLQTVRD